MLDLRRGLASLVWGAFLAAGGCGGAESKTAPPTPTETYSISGAVSGDTIDGVAVSLAGASSASTTTDAAGHFAFGGLSNGTYAVTPSKAGYAFDPLSTSITVSGSSVTVGAFRATAMAKTFVVSGEIDGPGKAS